MSLKFITFFMIWIIICCGMLPMMLHPLCRIKAELRFITEFYRCTGKKSQKEEAYGIRIRAFLRECPVCLQ